MAASTKMTFDGSTYDADRDQERLSSQLLRVQSLMRDGHWRTLREIALATGGSEASVSARLRDLRKPRFGGHAIARRHQGGGLFQYRMAAPKPKAIGDAVAQAFDFD